MVPVSQRSVAACEKSEQPLRMASNKASCNKSSASSGTRLRVRAMVSKWA